MLSCRACLWNLKTIGRENTLGSGALFRCFGNAAVLRQSYAARGDDLNRRSTNQHDGRNGPYPEQDERWDGRRSDRDNRRRGRYTDWGDSRSGNYTQRENGQHGDYTNRSDRGNGRYTERDGRPEGMISSGFEAAHSHLDGRAALEAAAQSQERKVSRPMKRRPLSSSSQPLNDTSVSEANRGPELIPPAMDFRKNRHRQIGKHDRDRYRASVGPAWEESPRSWLRSAQALNQRERYIAAMRRNVQEDTASDKSVLDEWRVKKELQYLKDPLALADRVRSLLKDAEKPDSPKAYSMVRIASRSLPCTVAWNHVMDFEMSKGNSTAALKAYNEMKKRAQVPDSYTFMILLRGIAEHAHAPQSLGKALSLYHSMASPGSHVRPSIKHTNVMLKVCARSEDMDALWGVAAKIPENGPGAADHWTFTTILNAMRMKAVLDVPDGLSLDQSARRRESTIIQGRRIWGAVIQKWRAGKILIDENLTCAMGRLLLIGARPRDWDDVFSLVEQTMAVPRMLPKLGTTARGSATHIPRLRAPYTPEDMREEDLNVKSEADEAKVSSEVEVDLEPRGEFNPVADAPSVFGGMDEDAMQGSDGKLGYAIPGKNTLSLVLEACLKSVARQTAEDYWNLLTDPHGYEVKPDSDNVHMYLRILRQARASTAAVDLLSTYFAPGWDGKASTPAQLTPMRKTFRIVLSNCVRDGHNPAALENARKAIGLMAESIPDADPRAVSMYLKLVSNASTHVMLEHVRELGPTIMDLRSFYNYGSVQRDSDSSAEEVLEVFHRLISIYDRLIYHGGLSIEQRQELQERKARCTHFVTTKERKSAAPAVEKARDDGFRRRSWRTSTRKDGYKLMRREGYPERRG